MSTPELHVVLVTDWREFIRLENDWRKLFLRSNSKSIFMTWEWVSSCGEAVNWRLDPFIIIVKDHNNEVVGIAPFYLNHYRLFGLIPYRILQLLPDAVKGSEYLEILVQGDCQHAVYESIFSYLRRRSDRWDCIWICRVSGWSGAVDRIRSGCAAVGFQHNSRPKSFSSTRLPATFAEFLQQLSSRSRSQLKRELRRINDDQNLRFVECQSEDDLGRYMDALFYLHRLRWQSVGQSGSFVRAPTEARFHELFAPIALQNNWLRLSALLDGGSFKAVQINYVYDHTSNPLQEGFDPNAVRGAGNALRGHVIENLIDEGIREYDFFGGHTEHKHRWSANERFGAEFLIGSKSLKGWVAKRLGFWPTGRYLRPCQR